MNDYTLRYLVPLINAPLLICSAAGVLLSSYGGESRKNHQLFTNPEFRAALLKQGKSEAPVLTEPESGVLFAIIITPDGGGIIAGPCLIDRSGAQDRFVSGVLLLWNILTGKEYTPSEFMESTLRAAPLLERSVSGTIFSRQERQLPHNPYEKEQREQECIRTGDVEGLKKSAAETYEGELGTLAANPLRQAKSIAVGVITLASRSAIAGGLSPELSFSMADAFIYEIEERLNDPIAVENASLLAQEAYAEAVKEKKAKALKTLANPLIRRAKDYIFRNMHGSVSVADMANSLGVSADYLSALFHKAEGKSITAYILDEKLSLSKRLLRSSDYSIQEISAYFGFTSQSYFTMKFRKSVGVTPAVYRRTYKNNVKT